jgi:hypothetical protein
MGLNANQEYAVLYRRWTPSQGWSLPVDIILIPFLGIAPSLQAVFLDNSGMVHLLYFAGGQSEGAIYYSRAHVSEVHDSRAWSDPAPIGVGAYDGLAALTGDGGGRLVLLYSGRHRGNGLYAIESSDGGLSWSAPLLVSPSRTPDTWPASIWLASDDSGNFHAVWHTMTALGGDEEIRYARFDVEGGRWDRRAVLARAENEQEMVGWPSIIVSPDGLVVVYQDSFPPTRWVRRSSDGGLTWSTPVRPFPHRGGYGYAIPVEDSDGSIHLVLGNRLQDPEIHGMWYSELVEDRWLPLEHIISGPATGSFDPCCPQAVISQGNVLLATWTHNVRREGLTGPWFSWMVLDAPEESVAVSAPPPTMIQPGEGVPASVQATPGVGEAGPTPDLSPGARSARRASNPGAAILLGTAPVVLLIAVLAIGRIVGSKPMASLQRGSLEGPGDRGPQE